MKDGIKSICIAGMLTAALALGTPLEPTMAQGSPWWARATGVSYGRFPVAFEERLLADSARPLSSGLPRPMQVSVWYPTPRPRDHHVMTYGDYVALAFTETTAADPPAGAARDAAALKILVSRGVPESIAADLLAEQMLAVVGAMRAPFPRFPLVVIAQGAGQSVHEQSVLAEYLTSYGYVVASSPSPTPTMGPMGEKGNAAGAADVQADDLAFVIAQLRTRSDVAPRYIGLIGYDAGSGGALTLAMRNKVVKALVSLDGQIGTATARASLETSPSFDVLRATIPVLHVYQDIDSTVTPDFGLLASLRSSELWLARTRDLRHPHFTSLGPAAAAFLPIREATAGTRLTGSEYGNVLRITVAFLDAFLKRNADAFRIGPALPLERIQPGAK